MSYVKISDRPTRWQTPPSGVHSGWRRTILLKDLPHFDGDVEAFKAPLIARLERDPEVRDAIAFVEGQFPKERMDSIEYGEIDCLEQLGDAFFTLREAENEQDLQYAFDALYDWADEYRVWVK